MMSFTRRLLALSAASAFLFGIAACDDDSNDTPVNNNSNVCQPGCNGNVATACVNGVAQLTTCAGATPVCSNGQCIAQPAQGDTCTQSVCNGNNIIECMGGVIMPERACDAATPVCDNGKCVASSSSGPACVATDYKPQCTAAGKLSTCVNGIIVESACPAGQTCTNNACVSSGGNGGGGETTSDLLVGAPCSCTGADCNITITGAELNSVIKVDLGDKKLADTDQVNAPNFFSKSITGCEKLAQAVPAGMAVGCMRSETIKFPAKVAEVANATTVTEIMNGITIGGMQLGQFMSFLPILGIDLSKIFDRLQPLFKDGIPFKAQNGYCIAAAIDIDVTMGDTLKDAVGDVNPLVNKINVGDHNVAKAAQCPAGSEHLSYHVGKDLSNLDMTMAKAFIQTLPDSLNIGKFDVGFDMCLKSCNTAADCRSSEGYDCLEIPTGNPAADYAVPEVCNNESYDDTTKFPKKKVCFDKSTYDYFKALTDDFETLMPKNDIMCSLSKKK